MVLTRKIEVLREFSDGEIQRLTLKNLSVVITFYSSIYKLPVNDNLFEILIMVDALKRASAETISVVMPYYGCYVKTVRHVNQSHLSWLLICAEVCVLIDF